MRTAWLATLAAGTTVLAACQDVAPTEAFEEVCNLMGQAALRVAVRDADGLPVAVGSTVRVVSASGAEEASEGWDDPLTVFAGSSGGTFDVHVAKPWHEPAVVRGVSVPADRCGRPTLTDVAVTLPLVPHAPEVRQVVLSPYDYGFGWGGLSTALTAHVMAAPGVSGDVVWLSRDPSVVQVTSGGMITSQCRTAYGSAWVVASSAVDPSQRDSVEVSVWADADPVRCPSASP